MEKQTTYLAIKLNQLHDKNTQFVPHRNVLLQCIIKSIIDQQKVEQTWSTNQTNRYHPTTKDSKHQKGGNSPIWSNSNTKQTQTSGESNKKQQKKWNNRIHEYIYINVNSQSELANGLQFTRRLTTKIEII